MDEVKQKTILNKRCKLVQTNSFILDGIVVAMDQYGIMFKTVQKTSFISWTNIRELTPLDGGN